MNVARSPSPHAALRNLRSDVSAALAAGSTDTDEAGLHVRQPDVIGPAVGADRCGVAATMIPAIDQYIADAG